MARQVKVGIDYFSHDVDILQDRKVKLIKAKHGLVGYAVFLRLLEELYRDKGYYLHIDDDFNILFIDDNSIEMDKYKEILGDCIDIGLFNKDIYEEHSILTSKRIQQNYCEATIRRKEVELIKEYLVLKESEIMDVYGSRKIDVNINTKSVGVNVNINTQGKGEDVDINKQSKVKESKEKKSNIYMLISDYTTNEELRQALKDFLHMRRKIKAPMTKRALKMLLTELDKLGEKDELKIKIVEQSILNNWKSVYPLKKSNNYNQKNKKDNFSDFEQRTDAYTPEELDKIARRKFNERNGGTE